MDGDYIMIPAHEYRHLCAIEELCEQAHDGELDGMEYEELMAAALWHKHRAERLEDAMKKLHIRAFAMQTAARNALEDA